MQTMVNERLVRRYGTSRGSIKDLMLKYVKKREGGELYSPTLREIFRVHHGVDIGMYTHGGCFRPFAFGENTSIGRYTSVAVTAFAATVNHPMHFKSMHGFFFNPALGVVDQEWEFSPLAIGNDVWLGHNSIIMPGVERVADGAVVAAGAVVNKDVPPYAVVVGNPARVVRYRFDQATIERLQTEKWWEQDLETIRQNLGEYTRDFGDPSRRVELTTVHDLGAPGP
jgi:virginiamycin A acetyltransferase